MYLSVSENEIVFCHIVGNAITNAKVRGTLKKARGPELPSSDAYG